MNTKKIPLFIMLLAGSVACIVTYINRYNLHDMLVVLLTVLILFLIIGLIVKKILDKFDISTDNKVDDEGEFVEKTDEEAEGQEADTDNAAVEEVVVQGGDTAPDQGV